MKPILFNTEMVRAILDGGKTQTRRPVHSAHLNRYASPKYCVGDILYVRETWGTWSPTFGTMPRIYYRADYDAPDSIVWRPSIHMPKEAARIFLRVTDVKVERLQDITINDIEAEGISADYAEIALSNPDRGKFIKLWNGTASDFDRYGWDANPWVWVIKFERISKEEAEG